MSGELQYFLTGFVYGGLAAAPIAIGLFIFVPRLLDAVIRMIGGKGKRDE